MRIKVVRTDKYYEYFCDKDGTILGMFHNYLLQPGASFSFWCPTCKEGVYFYSSQLRRETLDCSFVHGIGFIEL